MSAELPAVLLAKLLISLGFPEPAARSLVNEQPARFAELGGRLTALSKIGSRIIGGVPEEEPLTVDPEETDEVLYKMLQLATNVKIYTLNEQLGLMSLMALPGKLTERGYGDWVIQLATGVVRLGDLKEFKSKLSKPEFVNELVEKFDNNGERVIKIQPAAYQLAVACQFFFTTGTVSVDGSRKALNVQKRTFNAAEPEGFICNAKQLIAAFIKLNPRLHASLKALNLVVESQEDLASVLARNIQDGKLVVNKAQLVNEKKEVVSYAGLYQVAPRKKHFDEKSSLLLRQMSAPVDKDLSGVQNWYAAVNYNAQNSFAMDFYGTAYQYGANVYFAIAVIEFARRTKVKNICVPKGAQAEAIAILAPGEFMLAAVNAAGCKVAIPVNVSNVVEFVAKGDVLIVDATSLNLDVGRQLDDVNNVHFALNDPNVVFNGEPLALFNGLASKRLININFGHWHPIWKVVMHVNGKVLAPTEVVKIGTKTMPFRNRNVAYLTKQITTLATHMRLWLTCQLAMKVSGFTGQALQFDKDKMVVDLVNKASLNIVELAKRGSKIDGDFVLEGDVDGEDELVSTTAALEVSANYNKLAASEIEKGRAPARLDTKIATTAVTTSPVSMNSAFEEEDAEGEAEEAKDADMDKGKSEEIPVVDYSTASPGRGEEVHSSPYHNPTSPFYADYSPDSYGTHSAPYRPEDAVVAHGIQSSLREQALLHIASQKSMEVDDYDARDREKRARQRSVSPAPASFLEKKKAFRTQGDGKKRLVDLAKANAPVKGKVKPPTGRGRGGT